MEETQSAQSGKLLRYALRSGSKSKEEKPPAAFEPSNPSAKRGRPASAVSQSVGVLDLSVKDKPAKPPRRFSISTKPAGTPAPKLAGNTTPVSEARSWRSVKSETPASDVSKPPSLKKKFNALSSPSFWLTNIKVSEAVGKHSVSLGFFKLALEAGCEAQSLQRMRNELKSYADRHDISDLEDPLKEFLEGKNVVENFGQKNVAENEPLQVSETCSQVPEEGTRSSDDDVRSCSSTMATRKLKPKSLNPDATQVSPVKTSAKKEVAPKSLNTDATQVSPVKISAKKDVAPKSIPTARTTKGSSVKNSSNSAAVSENRVRGSTAKKPQKPKQESNKVKDRSKKLGNTVSSEQDSVNPTTAEEALHENKENEDASSVEVTNSTAVA